MKKTTLAAGALMIGVASFAPHLDAQGVQQPVEIAKVDVQSVEGAIGRPRSSAPKSSMTRTRRSGRLMISL